jgi:SAM-dependent methyltransferase
MEVREFLELFIKELEENSELRTYYRLLENKNLFLWRKAYLEQRLNYIARQLKSVSGSIWDAGCGYGTTSVFLALNGYDVYGNTLEYYFDHLEERFNYWGRFGNLSRLKIAYADLYDLHVKDASYAAIIVQDTLHHLEPVGEAMAIFHSALMPGGRLIACEENGRNPYIRMKNFMQRGFNRVKEYKDERLNKTIRFANEDAHSWQSWSKILEHAGLIRDELATEFIRKLPPVCYSEKNYRRLLVNNPESAKKLGFADQFLAFGINFTALKP